MHLHGDEIAPDILVFVNGKQISADVKELDTKEGWVDVDLPIIKSENRISKENGVNERYVPLFDYQTKRLTGKVELKRMQPPQTDS
jgi:hypothetical protein